MVLLKMERCSFVNEKNIKYIEYHDHEWGVVRKDDRYLFEMLVLESFQAGLSWECILNKRENIGAAMDDFDYEKIALYDDKKVLELLSNRGIIRNKLKIMAIIKNAQIFIEIREEYGSFSKYIWAYTDNKIIYHEYLTKNSLSDKISNDLCRRGMRFVGSTIIYSYLQAIGIINDHEKNCYLYE